MRAVTRHAAVTNYASTAEPSITPTLFGVSLTNLLQLGGAEYDRALLSWRPIVYTLIQNRAAIPRASFANPFLLLTFNLIELRAASM